MDVDIDDVADRGAWATRIGFIMAAVGSAVGLGNLWRFSYLTSENGGAAFLLIYAVLLVVLGIPALLAELALGRRSKLNAYDTFDTLGGGWWRIFGALAIFSSILLLSYYSVIAGWTISYIIDAFQGTFFADPGAYFTRIAEGPRALVLHAIFMVAVVAIVAGGVSKGIERASLILMPTLLAFIVGLSIWGLTLDGATAGLAFYLNPDFSIITWQTVVAAVGQVLFSIGLGLGTMLTYASYLDRDSDLAGDGMTIGFSDFGVAFISGFMVFPIIFAFGLQSAVSGSSVGTLFIAVPAAFANLGGVLGTGLALVFFLVLLFAALTSGISILEVSVSFLVDRFEVPRRKAAILLGEVVFGLGIASALSTEFLGLADTILGTVLLVLGALGVVVFVGYRLPDAAREMDRGSSLPVSRWAMPIIRYVVPVFLLVILLMGLGEMG